MIKKFFRVFALPIRYRLGRGEKIFHCKKMPRRYP